MKAKITIKQVFQIEIDGKPVEGSFSVVSDWEGLVKLESTSPMGSLLIHTPLKQLNTYDLIPKMLGGNKPNGEPLTFEAEVVRADCGHIGTAATKQFKRPL